MIQHIGYTEYELIYLIVFYSIGAFLGYLSFRHTYKNFFENLRYFTATVGTGIFLAYIITNYLEINHIFSKPINMLVGGLCSFGLPDLVLTYWPMLKKLVYKIINKKVAKKFDIEEEKTNGKK